MKTKSLIFMLSLSTILTMAGCSSHTSSAPAPATATSNHPQTNGKLQAQDQTASTATDKQSPTTVPTQSSTSPVVSPTVTKANKATAPIQPIATNAAKPDAPVPSAVPAAKNKTAPTPVQQTASFTIIGAKHQIIVSKMDVPLKSDDTVLSLLKEITREKGIQMEYRGSGAAAYVEGIDNVYEFDQGPKSGWMFRVNGNFGDRSCGSYAVHTGDVIQWLYSTNLGKDLGK